MTEAQLAARVSAHIRDRLKKNASKKDKSIFLSDEGWRLVAGLLDRCYARPSENQQQERTMHYRNGREAVNGDVIVSLGEAGRIVAVGTLRDAVAGNDYCNGKIEPIPADSGACLIDCLHADDVAAMLVEKGLGERPAPKPTEATAAETPAAE